MVFIFLKINILIIKYVKLKIRMENEKTIINSANFNNVSFKHISRNQKIENDKERIKSKFNFNISRTSTNSSANKRSSFASQQNSYFISDKMNKVKNKIKFKNSKIMNKNIRPFSCKRGSYEKKKINFTARRLNDTKISLSQNKRNKNNNLSESKERKNNTNNNSNNLSQLNSNIFNNITYNNYEYYYNSHSQQILGQEKNLLQESVLKTQIIGEGINNCSSKDNNEIDIKSINETGFDIKVKNEIEERATKKNEVKSFNNTSFSGSSKTAEINRDLLNIRNDENGLNEDNIKIVNNDNYIIRNFNGINNNNNKSDINNKNIESNNDNKPKNIEPEEKFLQQIFRPYHMNNNERKRTEINTSLLDEDDYNQENKMKMLNNVSKYYFIEDIIKKNNSYASLSFDKFNYLSTRAKYKIFSYIFDNYKNILNSSKAMRNIIKNMLEEKFGNSIKDFINKYENILHLENYQFNVHKFTRQKKSKKMYKNFCLYLQAKVLPNNEYLKKFGDISFEISYKYKIRCVKNEYNLKTIRTNSSNQSYISKDHIQEGYQQIYKFDLRNNKNYPMWLCSERDEIFNNATKIGNVHSNVLSKILTIDELYQKHLVYSSPVINVNENDIIVFRIDLIEDNNVIENLSFNDVIVQSVNRDYYHKNSYKSSQKFDGMRDCENEIAINVWHNESAIKDYYENINIIYQEFINKLKNNFQKYFEIMETKFDLSKFIFLRITMKAKKIGVLKNSIFSNKDIEIVDKNTPITRECVPINLVNTFSMSKNIVIKQGTVIDLYLAE